MEDFNSYIRFIEDVEANRFDCTPHFDEDGIAASPMTEAGSLFDSYEEDAA